MHAVMTYNAWMILATTVGSSFGFVISRPILQKCVYRPQSRDNMTGVEQNDTEENNVIPLSQVQGHTQRTVGELSGASCDSSKNIQHTNDCASSTLLSKASEDCHNDNSSSRSKDIASRDQTTTNKKCDKTICKEAFLAESDVDSDFSSSHDVKANK